MQVSPYHPSAPAAVRKAREASLSVKGAKLFNTLPRGLRDITTGTVDNFKRELDGWLEKISDQHTIPGRQWAATTNSLHLDQRVQNKTKIDFRKEIVDKQKDILENHFKA